MTAKTIAMRALDAKNIPYEVFTYDTTVRDATLVADEIGVPHQQVFKTLVVVRETGKPLLVMLPADRQLNLKRFARQISEKKVKMAGHNQAEELTGLQVGGISTLALLNRGFGVYLDDSAKSFDQIVISGGKKGLQVKLAVRDLIVITQARLINASD
jgi:Cys-tRNA(Pro)/Cys-tRNA(Cys) deacylase